MAGYLVGADNKTLFKKRFTWDFKAALAAAKDGDTLEIEREFFVVFEKNEENIIIDKNITIQGQLAETKDGQIIPTIQGGLFVKNRAAVTLRNIGIRRQIAKSNCLNVSNGSSVVAENVVIENTATEGENYPIVYVKEQSKLELNKITIMPSSIRDGKHKIYVADSKMR